MTLPALEPTLAQIREKFPPTPDQLIPLLQFAQAELGYLPPEAMKGIAAYLKVPASLVYGVATFYAQFRFAPLGRRRITVCRGTACHVRGSGRLVEDLEAELKIKAGQTTPDLGFSLLTVACFGACALAPVMLIDNKVHGKMTPKAVKQILNQLRDGANGPEPKRRAAPAAKPTKAKPAKQAAAKKAAPAKKKPKAGAKKKPGARKRNQ